MAYCQICNPFQYATSIMANPTVRAAHIKDTADLITAIQNNTLPSVSFGKPDGLLDGHPSSSKVDLFEAYTLNVLTALDANPQLKAETAVSSPGTRPAVTGTRASSSRSTSSATDRASRC